MITKLQLPTQLLPIFNLYDDNFDLSKEEFEKNAKEAIIDDDKVILADKNGNNIYGFVMAKKSIIRGRKCCEIVAAYTKNNNRGTWGSLVKSIIDWANKKSLNEVYILRNLRRRV